MIEEIVVSVLKRIGQRWNISGTLTEPDTEDVMQVLDHAAEVLFDKEVGTILTTGGIKVEKNEHGRLDVYVFAGEYI